MEIVLTGAGLAIKFLFLILSALASAKPRKKNLAKWEVNIFNKSSNYLVTYDPIFMKFADIKLRNIGLQRFHRDFIQNSDIKVLKLWNYVTF